VPTVLALRDWTALFRDREELAVDVGAPADPVAADTSLAGHLLAIDHHLGRAVEVEMEVDSSGEAVIGFKTRSGKCRGDRRRNDQSPKSRVGKVVAEKVGSGEDGRSLARPVVAPASSV